MPPAEKVLADLAGFCRQALADGQTPVLLAYSLGKTQALLRGLAFAGLPFMLAPPALKLTQIYEELGVIFPAYREFSAAAVAGHVVICPPHTTALLQKIPAPRTAAVTGWALDAGAVYRYRCDAAFPLSDHADFNELLAFVDRVRPRRVFTVHGFAREFAQTLRARGVEAWALGRENQLELGLAAGAGAVPSGPPGK
jgi:Cft2 family RNA processing exonuclease